MPPKLLFLDYLIEMIESGKIYFQINKNHTDLDIDPAMKILQNSGQI